MLQLPNILKLKRLVELVALAVFYFVQHFCVSQCHRIVHVRRVHWRLVLETVLLFHLGDLELRHDFIL